MLFAPGGSFLERQKKLVIAELHGIARVNAAGIDSAGCLRSQASVEFDLQAEQSLKRRHGRASGKRIGSVLTISIRLPMWPVKPVPGRNGAGEPRHEDVCPGVAPSGCQDG